MRILPLSNSKIPVLVDDEDYDDLMQFNWQLNVRTGYITRSNWHDGKHDTEYLHRRIMKAPKGMDVDHIDRNRFNDQKSNLRICRRSENMANSVPRRGLSKYKGVSKLNRPNLKKKWLSYIKVEYKTYYNGYYETEAEAAHVYNQFAEQIFGEFAYINDISEEDV